MSTQETRAGELTAGERGAIDAVDTAAITTDLRWFAQLGLRLAGTPAEHAGAAYVRDRLKAAGIACELEAYDGWVSYGDVPEQFGPATVTLPDGSTLAGKIYAFGGSTPAQGVSAELVWVGAGSPEDVAAVDLRGRIALSQLSMDAPLPCCVPRPSSRASEVQQLRRSAGLTHDLTCASPRLTVDPGERFLVQTEDALNGALEGEEHPPDAEHLGEALAADRFNPCSGPIAVRGARPGHVLAIHVEAIDLAPAGVAAVFAGVGPLHDSATYPDCRGPFTKRIGQSPEGVASYGTLTWPLRPHIGTVAVAPARPLSAGADANYGQGAFGGNLDCREVAQGNTLLLPVLVDDAQLFVGDVHGSMADGELFGTGVESRAELTLRCELRRAPTLPFARVETPTHVIQLCSDRPVEAAIEQAFRWVLAWLTADHAVSARDAYVLLGIHPGVRIDVYQLVRLGRLAATVGVAVPRTLLEQLA